MEHGKHNNKFGSGFFWGLIFGAGLVILLGTKKGRELLRELTEKGAQMLEDFLREQGLAEDEEEESLVVDPVDVSATEEKTNGSAKKRIFKGVKRKVASKS